MAQAMLKEIKNICFINTITGWGSGEKWHFQTAIKLANMGYSIFFIVNKNSVLQERLSIYENIKVLPLEFQKFSYLNPLIHYKLFKHNKIDTVFFNSIRGVNTGSSGAFFAEVNRRIFRYGSYKRLKKKLQTYISFKFFLTDVFANSKSLKEEKNLWIGI